MFKTLFSVFAGLSAALCCCYGGELILSSSGKALYGIYAGTHPAPADAFAVRELREHLKLMSGADFVLLDRPQKNTIYVGLTPEAKQALGSECRMDSLKDQESMIQTRAGQLFLYGKGVHGNLYAVYELLENQFGCRWLTAHGERYVPRRNRISVREGTVRTTYSFSTRALMNYFYRDKETAFRYAYRNRQNNLLRWPKDLQRRNPGLFPKVPQTMSTHILSRVIPGFKGRGINPPEKWVGIRDYYKVHPEWFSMDEDGHRVNNRQLCFSNPDLAKELEKNLIEFYRRSKSRYDSCLLTVDLNDNAQNMCRCQNCQSMQKRYKTPGAPFFDFLFRMCRHYPEIQFQTLAYQRSLTQIPPVGMDNPPRNLTVIFCPINGSFSGTLDKENRRDLEDLKNWRKLVSEIWVWYYPNTYSDGTMAVVPPTGIFERVAADIRTLRDCGVDGTYFEHDSGGMTAGANLADMQAWVMYKLFENADRDVHALMGDFAGHYYGKAAPMILKFAGELEEGRKKANSSGRGWVYNTQNYDYLTESNLLRWNKMFDQAEKLVSGEQKFRLSMARMGLDCVMIYKLFGKNHDAQLKDCTDRLKRTAAEAERRIKTSFHHTDRINEWLRKMAERKPSKPLPAELRNIPDGKIVILLPERTGRKEYQAQDPEANMEFAKVEPWNGKFLMVGTYDPVTKKYGPGRKIHPDPSGYGKYSLYKISDEVRLTPSMFLWAGKWNLHLPMGKCFRYDDVQAMTSRWQLFVSLKFTADKVYLDRGFLVKKP